jgi:hypothetical protein
LSPASCGFAGHSPGHLLADLLWLGVAVLGRFEGLSRQHSASDFAAFPCSM